MRRCCRARLLQRPATFRSRRRPGHAPERASGIRVLVRRDGQDRGCCRKRIREAAYALSTAKIRAVLRPAPPMCVRPEPHQMVWVGGQSAQTKRAFIELETDRAAAHPSAARRVLELAGRFEPQAL